MGSPENEEGREEHESQHQVTLTSDFIIQTTEVTFSQFREVMGFTSDVSAEYGPDFPASKVDWHQAAQYCNELSKRQGLGECYSCRNDSPNFACRPNIDYGFPYHCPGYRLPTEAEWEFAARAETKTARYGNLDNVAWHKSNSGEAPQRVATLAPNPWGIYDMLGNLLEWCHDFYTEHPSGPVENPWQPIRDASIDESTAGTMSIEEAAKALAIADSRVVRGGTACLDSGASRAAFRNGLWSFAQNPCVGFRPVKLVPPSVNLR
jgi:formylglycine-generating enzyme required for sulfatase activity